MNTDKSNAILQKLQFIEALGKAPKQGQTKDQTVKHPVDAAVTQATNELYAMLGDYTGHNPDMQEPGKTPNSVNPQTWHPSMPHSSSPQAQVATTNQPNPEHAAVQPSFPVASGQQPNDAVDANGNTTPTVGHGAQAQQPNAYTTTTDSHGKHVARADELGVADDNGKHGKHAKK